MRLGILGGTFDPVHFGHLRPAVEVRSAFALDEIRLLPCRVSPHRSTPAASMQDRLDMLRAAVGDADDLVVDARELEREGPSYTIDTVASFQAEWPDARLYLILGSDAFAAFDRWHRWRDILACVNVVVTHRAGTALEIPQALADAVVDSTGSKDLAASGHVHIQPVSQLDISATRIRELAARGEDLRYLLPATAHDLLSERELYRNPKPTDGSTAHAE